MMNKKLEMTYEMWKCWQNWMDENRTVNKAAEDPYSRYHRMAAPVKMSRKRLRGLLMASGAQPRIVDAYLKKMHADGYSYMEIWDHNKYVLVPRIKRRKEALAFDRALHAIFGDPPVKSPEERSATIKKYEDKKRAKYEADKELVDAHPEIMRRLDAMIARDAYMTSCISQKADGTKQFEIDAFDMDKYRAFCRLINWYSFADWYMDNCTAAG